MADNNNHNQPERVLGFDFGKKRIGVAFGQSITQTARPLVTLQADNGVPKWQEIQALIAKWRPDAIIVGIPLNMDGTEQDITHDAREFAHQLAEKFNIVVHEMDERLTTKAAKEYIFNEKGYKGLQEGQIDQVAAKLIIENWFAQH